MRLVSSLPGKRVAIVQVKGQISGRGFLGLPQWGLSLMPVVFDNQSPVPFITLEAASEGVYVPFAEVRPDLG